MTFADDIGLVSPALAEVLQTFDEELRSEQPLVNELLQRMAAYRGKLLRPKLLLLSARALGEIKREHIVLAAVVEMIHVATLVHDDVLDEADLRRRSPTANRFLGNEGAILLGDYLISHSYHLCGSLGEPLFARRLTAATNVVCEGELMQIARRKDFNLSEAHYLEIIRGKTAALTGVCCELGALASGASPTIVDQLTAYGRNLGMAFQIVDDLLDFTATSSEAGKSVGRDADLGELTLPLIRFRDTASQPDREQLRMALSDNQGNRNERLRRLLAGSDALDYAYSVAHQFSSSAVDCLVCLPESEARKILGDLAKYVVSRRH